MQSCLANPKTPSVLNKGMEVFPVLIVGGGSKNELCPFIVFTVRKTSTNMCCKGFLKVMMFLFNGGIFVSKSGRTTIYFVSDGAVSLT